MLSRDVPERVSLTLVSQGEQVKVSTIGGRAYLVDAPGDFDLPAQRRIWALAALLRQRDDIESLIPGVTNLLV
ncbi:carboxyltransferase domain-containing protein, partial [Lonsdalea britannica]